MDGERDIMVPAESKKESLALVGHFRVEGSVEVSPDELLDSLVQFQTLEELGFKVEINLKVVGATDIDLGEMNPDVQDALRFLDKLGLFPRFNQHGFKEDAVTAARAAPKTGEDRRTRTWATGLQVNPQFDAKVLSALRVLAGNGKRECDTGDIADQMKRVHAAPEMEHGAMISSIGASIRQLEKQGKIALRREAGPFPGGKKIWINLDGLKVTQA